MRVQSSRYEETPVVKDGIEVILHDLKFSSINNGKGVMITYPDGMIVENHCISYEDALRFEKERVIREPKMWPSLEKEISEEEYKRSNQIRMFATGKSIN